MMSELDTELTLKQVIEKFIEWWKYLLGKWKLIVAVGILGAVCGIVYSHFKNPVYTATTTFVLEESTSATGGMLSQLGGLAGLTGLDVGGGSGMFQGDNLLELYRSRTMIEKTLLSKTSNNNSDLLLIDQYIHINGLKEKWKKKLELADLNFNLYSGRGSNRLQDSIIGLIVSDINKKYLKVSRPDKKLSIVKVEVTSVSESFARSFNDQIVKNVNDFYVSTKTKKTLKNVRILQNKVDSVKAVLNGAVYTSVAVADATPNLNVTRQVQRAVPIQRAQISMETSKAVLGELIKNLEMFKMALLQETPLIQVIDSPVLPLQRTTLGKTMAALTGGLISGFLIVISLLFKKIFKDLLA